jgi:hypothetical protein
MGRMDRAIYEFEIASLDQFYNVFTERYAHLASLSPEVQQLVERLNDYATEGSRELYEVVE